MEKQTQIKYLLLMAHSSVFVRIGYPKPLIYLYSGPVFVSQGEFIMSSALILLF